MTLTIADILFLLVLMIYSSKQFFTMTVIFFKFRRENDLINLVIWASVTVLTAIHILNVTK